MVHSPDGDITYVVTSTCVFQELHRETHLWTYFLREKSILKNREKSARTKEKYGLLCYNPIRLCQTSRTYRWANNILKLTLTIISQSKVIKRYPNKSSTLRVEDQKALANAWSRTGPMNTIGQLLLSGLPACQLTQVRVIHWSSDSIYFSNSTVLHSVVKIVDLPYNTRD